MSLETIGLPKAFKYHHYLGNDATRPDTRPVPVGDRGRNARFHHNRRTDRQKDQQTDKAIYRVACAQLKSMVKHLVAVLCWRLGLKKKLCTQIRSIVLPLSPT